MIRFVPCPTCGKGMTPHFMAAGNEPLWCERCGDPIDAFYGHEVEREDDEC